mgnify:CR=1 FL=1
MITATTAEFTLKCEEGYEYRLYEGEPDIFHLKYHQDNGEHAEYITFNMMDFQALIELMGDALYFYSHRK